MVQDPEWQSHAAAAREHVAAAQAWLQRSNVPTRDRLREAGRLFWKALFHKDDWPELLRSRAAALVAQLFRHGPIEVTISRLNDQDLTQTMRELDGFCREFLLTDSDDPLQ